MHLGDHVRLLVKQRNGKCFGGKEEIMIYIVLAVGALIAGIVTAIAGGGGILIVTLLMLLDTPIKLVIGTNRFRITSYNVCYTKLLRLATSSGVSSLKGLS